MPLFIDRLPFHCWTDRTRTPPEEYWSVVLPILVTEPRLLSPPASATFQEWLLDTANRGQAFAWRYHLLHAGLDPEQRRRTSRMRIRSTLGMEELVPIRAADLWLGSNLPAFQDKPYRMELPVGLPFRDVPTLPDPQFHRPLVGIHTLRLAGLKVEIDFGHDTVSVWTPDQAGPNP